MGYWDLVQPIWRRIDTGSPEAFMRTYASAPAPGRTLLAAHWCASDTSQGGLGHFFAQSSGVLAPEAAQAFDCIGMPGTARILRNAMAFFGPDYPREVEVRNVVVEKRRRTRRKGASNVFGELSRSFDQSMESENGGFDEAADRFADAHADAGHSPADPTFPAIALHYLEKVSIYDGSRIFFQQASRVPEKARVVMVVHLFARDALQGGMERFFGGCAGMAATLAADAFIEIGLPEVSRIIHEALLFFPGVYSFLQFERAEDLNAYRKVAGKGGPSPFHEADLRLAQLLGRNGEILASAANLYLASGDVQS